MAETADLVVVGGGIIGCSVVHHLALLLPRSTRIVLLDRGPIAGATSGSCMGHLMVTPDDPQQYAFSASSVRLWRELQSRQGGFDYNPTGALYLAETAEDLELLPELRRQFVDNGDRADILDPIQLRELEPGLAHDLPGALYYPGDGVVLPMSACSAMLREARSANSSLVVRSHCAVLGFEREGDRITAVRTANGPIGTRTVVNATGVWAPELAEMLGQPRLPIYPRAGNLAITGHHVSPIRTQLLEVSYLRFAHGAAKVDPTRTEGDPGGHAVNMQPQTNGSCLIGSTRQFRGMDRTLNRELLHRSLARAQRYAPGLRHAPIVRTWVGLRPYSIDKHPLIGPWPHVQGLWIAAGHEGLGISLAPITGRLLAQQIAGQPCDIDHRPYLPSRFAS
ncbi:MAG TPA: FAD-dependent oxidoreductase [Planctomycetota bacterium]|nr:FAD-dependent oxidoreductase [Planctomycetota bacterium]